MVRSLGDSWRSRALSGFKALLKSIKFMCVCVLLVAGLPTGWTSEVEGAVSPRAVADMFDGVAGFPDRFGDLCFEFVRS